ncbi:MAG: 3-dehydroquinate synthase [Bacillota bacterium]|nr:MAG: 3-dehydroquinate synthase [Planctomycetota bacterium]RUA09586.1 MAG: 3-dehydroquinate synthase [Bacillota bacterium]
MTRGQMDTRIEWPDACCQLRIGPLDEAIDDELLGPLPTSQLLLRDSGVEESSLDSLRQILSRRAPLVEQVVAGGEESKHSASFRNILEMMAESGLDRGGLLLVAGGGALADSAAFAASIWHRGVPWIAIPTTLLAMVDAHIGGKTAIHFEGIKNRIGSFHLPRAVISDVGFLDSLPVYQRAMGWAELIKAAWIGDPDLFESLENDPAAIPKNLIPTVEQLASAVAVKVAIVEQDPFEENRREVLNLGHTLAHALEMNTSPPMLHGEAVARGFCFAARLAEEIGEAPAGTERRIAKVLKRVGLPTDLGGFDLEVVMPALLADKKARGQQGRWVIPCAPGKVVVKSVPTEVVERLLRSSPPESIVNPAG